MQLGRRYQVLEQIGAGGMGAVYRAVDLLTGQQVALKRLVLASAMRGGTAAQSSSAETIVISGSPTSQTDTRQDGDGHVPEALRLALAQEFRTLASLRHPHIISVIDYGFDGAFQPYFTMELLGSGRSLLAAVRQTALEQRVGVLLQILQALTYLHRRGVLHRDIKPANVLVVDGPRGLHAKLLDFGLAMLREGPDGRSREIAGTLGYIAPEVLMGENPSELSDLYSVGVVAFELLAGWPPFPQQQPEQILKAVLDHEPDYAATALPAPLQAVLRRLLAKRPAERYPDAEAAAEALTAASGVALPGENEGLRDSFLQAAKFIGRDGELARLRVALQGALAGAGAAWLLGGESGVGKSRLLDELRSVALVQGVQVLLGQATSDGALGLGLFAALLRPLCLQVELLPLEASVIKSLIPELPALLGREVADAPVVDAQAARLRLLSVLEAVLLRPSHPTLVILEDLQWTTLDNLDLLRRLIPQLPSRPLLLIGTFRNDERATLPTELPGATLMTLDRLSQDAIQELSTFMLGPAGRRPELIELLQRETEGNAFFIVEVMRALAAEAGTLAAVGRLLPPAQVTAGGVRTVLQRRLQRVPAAAQPLLQRAAVAGRQLDLALLGSLERDLERWLHTAAAAGVLELYEERWRFSHDKLRETLLAQLDAAELRALHREVAEALERVRPDGSAAAALAYHYSQSGVSERSTYYAALAGEQAVQRGALAEAVPLLKQAIEHAGTAALRLYRLLISALFGLGRMAECTEVLHRALASYGEPLPKGQGQLGLALLKQLGLQVMHRSHPRFIRAAADASDSEALEERNIIFGIAIEIHAWLGAPLETAYSIFQVLNLAERHGNVGLRISGYGAVGFLFSLTPLMRLSESYMRRGRALLSPDLDPMRELGFYRAALAASINHGVLPRIDPDDLPRAMALAQKLGDLYAQMFLLAVQAQIEWLAGDEVRSRVSVDALIEMARRSDHVIGLVLGKVLQCVQAQQRGRHAEALAALDELALKAQREGLSVYGSLSDALRVLCLARQGLFAQAREIADRSLAALAVMPVTNSLAGYCGPALVETYLELWQHLTAAAQRAALATPIREALRALRRVAAIIRIAEPASVLLEGQYKWLRGHQSAARSCFRKSKQLAIAMGMPRDAARAAAWQGRATAGPEGRAILAAAHQRLRELGAAWDAAQIERWLV
ncbi:MAG TPA: protein kinase [Pseudomonadota bacterium]|nr:protein kinase [Pseudomonadota bacterium]